MLSPSNGRGISGGWQEIYRPWNTSPRCTVRVLLHTYLARSVREDNFFCQAWRNSLTSSTNKQGVPSLPPKLCLCGRVGTLSTVPLSFLCVSSSSFRVPGGSILISKARKLSRWSLARSGTTQNSAYRRHNTKSRHTELALTLLSFKNLSDDDDFTHDCDNQVSLQDSRERGEGSRPTPTHTARQRQ